MVHPIEVTLDISIICIGELSKNMAEGASFVVAEATSHTKVYHFDTKADFFLKTTSLLQKGDTILVKASHGMEFPEIVEHLKGLKLS